VKSGAAAGLPLAYDAQADKDSWAQLDRFLKKLYGGK
jgi:hypothetical protein